MSLFLCAASSLPNFLLYGLQAPVLERRQNSTYKDALQSSSQDSARSSSETNPQFTYSVPASFRESSLAPWIWNIGHKLRWLTIIQVSVFAQLTWVLIRDKVNPPGYVLEFRRPGITVELSGSDRAYGSVLSL